MLFEADEKILKGLRGFDLRILFCITRDFFSGFFAFFKSYAVFPKFDIRH